MFNLLFKHGRQMSFQRTVKLEKPMVELKGYQQNPGNKTRNYQRKILGNNQIRSSYDANKETKLKLPTGRNVKRQKLDYQPMGKRKRGRPEIVVKECGTQLETRNGKADRTSSELQMGLRQNDEQEKINEDQLHRSSLGYPINGRRFSQQKNLDT